MCECSGLPPSFTIIELYDFISHLNVLHDRPSATHLSAKDARSIIKNENYGIPLLRCDIKSVTVKDFYKSLNICWYFSP